MSVLKYKDPSTDEWIAVASGVSDGANIEAIYPIGSIYSSVLATNPSELFGFGTWELSDKFVIDTGWQDFTYKNSTYMGTSQSSYNRNQWRVKSNVLYVIVGAGCTSTINHATEDEIARLPIIGGVAEVNASDALRIWTGAVGGSGAQGGFYLKQNENYVSVHIKPHTSSSDLAAPWYSTFFAIPLLDGYTFASGEYETKYVWKRTA